MNENIKVYFLLNAANSATAYAHLLSRLHGAIHADEEEHQSLKLMETPGTTDTVYLLSIMTP